MSEEDKEEYRTVRVYEENHKQIKIWAAQAGVTMAEIVWDLVDFAEAGYHVPFRDPDW